MKRCSVPGILLIATAILLAGCQSAIDSYDTQRATIAEEVENELNRKLDLWYPRVIDTQQGGYLSNFTFDWQQMEAQEKMIVTQARHLWTLSKVGKNESLNRDYISFADHGFEFLRGEMWDSESGGFFQTVTREGEPQTGFSGNISKTLYGNVFAIYGLAAYYDYSGNEEALELAIETFRWLDENARDDEHGGYFQNLNREGEPTGQNPLKDYNSGIHTLEAFYELYTVWPDEVLRERLEEMFHIVRDTMTDSRGFLNLYFEPDWTHVSYSDSTREVIIQNLGRDHVTPGHDIETAYLLDEAAKALGEQDDPYTWQISKQLVDHTLDHGWDNETGGIIDTGYYFSDETDMTVISDSKSWWAQAEALNSLLLMADRYPEDPRNYFEKFENQWGYINSYLIDHEHGGWYDSGLDTSPDSRDARKSQIWKGNYHTVRSLMEVLHRLRD